MSTVVTMTPELAREWLADDTKVPACWASIFSTESKKGKRRRMLITAFADGFYLESDGETVTAPMTPKMFTQYAHSISYVMVCIPNPEVVQLKALIASTEAKVGWTLQQRESQAFLQASRNYLAVMPEYETMTLQYAQYLNFYATGAAHAIRKTNVHRAFFDRFVNAKPI